MNLFVADPHWGWWIILYFFFGGVAAGAYFIATLIDLTGHESDRELASLGYWIAFPLVIICGALLTVDLDRPERFWHMLFKSEVVKEAIDDGWPAKGAGWQKMVSAPLLKYWSPMSIGAWALLLFGLFSGLSLLGSLWPGGRLFRWLRQGVVGRVVQALGCLVGFFVAAYTGALLTATNQPIWSESVWIGALFLTSAASTGIAAIIILARYHGLADLEALHRLERADLWALGLELAVLGIFLASLGSSLAAFLTSWPGWVLVGGAMTLGVLLPLALHLRLGFASLRAAAWASVFALAGGFLLRFTIVSLPSDLLSRSEVSVIGFGPEDGRVRGGGAGADPKNHPADVHPKSKLFNDGAP
jgi:formate-dependent nitrite reductase membrane component NrfD